MQFSRLRATAVNLIDATPPERAAAWAAAGLAFLLALVVLNNTLDEAAAGSQWLATSLGGLIGAFLASRLAAYLVRVARLWAGWPALSHRQRLALALLLALGSAAVMLSILLLIS